MQVVCGAWMRHSLHLRSLLIKRHFSEHKTLRTPYSSRCWSDCWFSSAELLQVDSGARTRHSLHLRDPLIEQHFSLDANLFLNPDASVAPLCSRRFTAERPTFLHHSGKRDETSPFAMLLLLWCCAFAWALKDSFLSLVTRARSEAFL